MPKFSQSRLLLYLTLALSGLVYLATLRFDFVYDDHQQIVVSNAIHSWKFLPHYFVTHVWEDAQPWSIGRYYRPIFSVWLLINYMLFGAAPMGWHLTTVLAHVAATALFFRLALRITHDETSALFAALIFGIHPAHVEAIAWVSGVTEPLLAIFLISSVLFYLRTKEQPAASGVASIAALFFYALAVFEKETAVALPIILFAYEWLFAPPTLAASGWVSRMRSAFVRVMPFLGVTLIYLAARWAVLKSLRVNTVGLPLDAFALTEPKVLLFYVRHLLWPYELSMSYDLPYVMQPELRAFWIPLLLLGILGYTLYRLARRSRPALFALAWMGATLVPVLNLEVLGGDEIVHDRYLYLPSMGLAILAGMALSRLRLPRGVNGGNLGQIGAAILLVVVLGTLTIRESSYWENDLILYRRAASIAPNNDTAVHSLALEMANLGMYKDAIPLLRQELRRKPNSFEGNAALGRCYFSVGSYLQAEPLLARAIELRPLTSRVPYAYLGMTRVELGQLEAAEEIVRRGLAIQPFDADDKLIHQALGTILERRGDWRGALDEYRSELAVNPKTPGILKQIAMIQDKLKSSH